MKNWREKKGQKEKISNNWYERVSETSWNNYTKHNIFLLSLLNEGLPFLQPPDRNELTSFSNTVFECYVQTLMTMKEIKI